MNIEASHIIPQKSAFLWVAVATAAILLIPLVAMQFTDEVNWDIADFIAMSILMSGMGGVFVLISRRVHRKRLVVIGTILAIVFLYSWAELAVGIFRDIGS